jgi:tRNA G18 (ribose-2'-O)-methylase SpoU
VEPIRIETANDPRVADFGDVSDPVLVRQQGLFVAEGRFVVRRLLANPRYVFRALLVTDTAFGALSDELSAANRQPPVYITSRPVIRQIGGYDFHQGCLGLAERPPAVDVRALLSDVPLVRPIVILEQVANPDNIGAIFRNAAALGAAAVLLSPGCVDPLYRKAIRTSIGATLHVPYAVVHDWPDGLAQVRERGYHLVALTPDATATRLDRYVLPTPGGVALLLGNEGDGLTQAALGGADAHVRIPVDPPVDSLNVATAAALALHQLRNLSEAD